MIIFPLNYPFQLVAGPLVSAIAAGNTFMIKPSEFSENTSSLIKQMVEEVFNITEVSVIPSVKICYLSNYFLFHHKSIQKV
ncbi:MAG: aldehyde dehydrogenase family protein [Bacteroidota bacterium]